MAESFLRPQADDQLPLRVEPHPVLLEVLAGHLAAEAQNALRLAVAVVLRVAGGLGQLLDHQVLGRVGGVAHAQVDHVVAGPPLLVLQAVDLGEQVGGQPPHPLGHLDRERPALRDGFDRLLRFIAHGWNPHSRIPRFGPAGKPHPAAERRGDAGDAGRGRRGERQPRRRGEWLLQGTSSARVCKFARVSRPRRRPTEGLRHGRETFKAAVWLGRRPATTRGTVGRPSKRRCGSVGDRPQRVLAGGFGALARWKSAA